MSSWSFSHVQEILSTSILTSTSLIAGETEAQRSASFTDDADKAQGSRMTYTLPHFMQCSLSDNIKARIHDVLLDLISDSTKIVMFLSLGLMW